MRVCERKTTGIFELFLAQFFFFVFRWAYALTRRAGSSSTVAPLFCFLTAISFHKSNTSSSSRSVKFSLSATQFFFLVIVALLADDLITVVRFLILYFFATIHSLFFFLCVHVLYNKLSCSFHFKCCYYFNFLFYKSIGIILKKKKFFPFGQIKSIVGSWRSTFDFFPEAIYTP